MQTSKLVSIILYIIALVFFKFFLYYKYTEQVSGFKTKITLYLTLLFILAGVATSIVDKKKNGYSFTTSDYLNILVILIAVFLSYCALVQNWSELAMVGNVLIAILSGCEFMGGISA